MAARPVKIAVFALWASTFAVQLSSFLDPSATATATSAEATPPLDGAALRILLLFVVMEALFAAVPFVYRHAHAHHAHGARAGNGRLWEVVAFVLCVVVGLLQLFLFVQPAGGGGAADGGDAQARALGVLALRALPASAAATFFLGVALVYTHVIGGNVNGPGVPEPDVRILEEITLGAAAALLGIMAIAVCTL